VNFTREPIIETIISAKDGYKLAIRSSKQGSLEEFLVDAIEVVSYGGTFFYRSQERPKSFFVPATDYLITEVREAKMVLKQPSVEKAIKIGGGKEASQKPPKEDSSEEKVQSAEKQTQEGEPAKGEQKRERRRHKKSKRDKLPAQQAALPSGEKAPSDGEAPRVIPPMALSHLLQPPETLISETLHRYKRELAPVPEIAPELVSDLEAPLLAAEADAQLEPSYPNEHIDEEPLFFAIEPGERPHHEE
jgi:hypothetical protein